MKELKNRDIPYKIYLSEDEMPRYWYNVRADMKNKPAPLLNPGTLKPMTAEEMGHVFCAELVKQEMDDHTPYIPIPEDVRNFYKMYRPSPLVRAYCLEDKLGTPAHIYYKFEGNNTSGSHKLNSAIAQAYYAKEQGLTGVTTETGAGQWGTALSMACAYLGLDCHVFMVKCSYEQKPFRREVMRTYGADVTPSPSLTTEVGRKILAEFPDTTGSLGCAISEAVECAASTPNTRYVLGSVLNQVLLHQSVIGLESKLAMEKLEKDWVKYPILHLDLNTEKYDTPESLENKLNGALVEWEKIYGEEPSDKSLAMRFEGIIRRACQQEGQSVVILVDEYDKPMLQAIGDDVLQKSFRNTLKAFYGALKSQDGCIKFALLTGVTKFGKVSVFSDLNNLDDISMWNK